MKIRITPFAISFLGLLTTLNAHAQIESYELHLPQAENEAIRNSNRLKSYGSDLEAATEQAKAQLAALLPRLTLESSFQYLSTVPNIPVPPPFPQVTLGANTSYSIGPVLRYTLWDTGASRDAYGSSLRQAEARREDQKNARIQLLLSVRSAYTQVQLALEELRLVNSSLDLAKAQDRDVGLRFRAGAAARLDVVITHRQVLSYQLQFQQRQADLSASLKDLLALLGARPPRDISKPGPEGVEGVTLVMKLDPLQYVIEREGSATIPPPDDTQPQIRTQELQAQSAELQSSSQKSALYPTVQLSAKTSLDYPNGPVLERINQNTVALSLSMPLFEWGRTRHLAAQQFKNAETARFRESQTRIDLNRDFSKARELLGSLQEQRKLAAQDIIESQDAARLNYEAYKLGKINFTDVQNANNQALLSQVGAARIDAQIVSQLISLRALSGEESNHDSQ